MDHDLDQIPEHDQSRRTRRTALVIGGGAVFLLAVIGAAAVALAPGDSDHQADTTNLLAQTQQTCDAPANGTRLEGDGARLLVDSTGTKDKSGLSLTSLECVLDQAKVPESVKEKMFSTRPSDGRQDGTWPGFTASWTYDPGEGLDLTISRTA
ncbi:hypothetical protein AB0J74_34270 [Asanoa sp. NPDC049573]|uniref:hypothetical protein n=1 Tax=Asanoa sp. NPDC049573 TaxID=3155396 RepID=UPI003431B3BF